MKSTSYAKIIYAVLLISSLGCATATTRGVDRRNPSSTEEYMNEQNKQIVTSFFELFSAGKAKEAFALVAPDVKWWVPESLPFGGTYDRTGYLTKVLPQFVGFQGGMKLTVKSLISERNTVTAEVESYGVHACGEPKPFVYNNKYHFRIVIENGVFVDVKEYMDTHHLAELYAVTQTAECKAKLKR